MFCKIVIALIAVAVVTGIGGVSFSAAIMKDGDQHDHQQAATSEQGGGAEAEKGKVSEDGRKAGEIGNAVCPVSGESIDEKVKVTSEYKGKIYSFCCQGCVDEFKKDPDKYIEKMREKETEGSKQGQSTHKGHHHNH